MPKYHLHFATDKEHDMRSMLQLALASDVAGKTAAIICPEAGLYTLKQHKYLRQNFVSVYVTDDNRALDMHKHFMVAGGILSTLGLSVDCKRLINSIVLRKVRRTPCR